MAVETLQRLLKHYEETGQTKRAEEVKARLEMKGAKVSEPKESKSKK